MSPDRFPFYIGDTVDVAANLDVNEYNGEKSVSVKIKDVRLHGVKQDKLVVGRQYYENIAATSRWRKKSENTSARSGRT